MEIESPSALLHQVYMPAHGFDALTVVRLSGRNRYALAQADSATDCANICGVIASVLDANRFMLALPGSLVHGFDDLVAGSRYFLSATIAGSLTRAPPPGGYVIDVLTAVTETTGVVATSLGDAHDEVRGRDFMTPRVFARQVGSPGPSSSMTADEAIMAMKAFAPSPPRSLDDHDRAQAIIAAQIFGA